MANNEQRPVFRQVSNLTSKEARYEPFSWYKEKRQKDPVSWDPERKNWDVFDYDTVKTVLENKDLFSSNRMAPEAEADSQASPLGVSLINIDPPKHRQMRSLVNKAFTPKAMESWRPRIERITQTLMDDIEGYKNIDFVDAISFPLPVMVISEIIGVPAEDQRQFKEWSNTIVAGPKDNKEETLKALGEKKMQAHEELGGYFEEILDHKRREPGDDIISVLLAADIDGEKLSENELIGFCILLLIAGNETTTNLLSNAIYTFTEYPESYEAIKKDPDARIAGAIEEVLRFRSPVQSMNRVVKTDTELGGRTLEAGQFVSAWIGSANRDDNQFPEADRFDIFRKPNRHLAFGKGIHFCLGAPLARMEAETALRAWIRRYPEFRRSDDFTLDPIESTFVYGLKSLQITVK